MFRRNGKETFSNHRTTDMKVNMSPRQTVPVAPISIDVGPHRMSTSSPDVSPTRSCVSSEDNLKYSSSPETTSMVLVGCPRCLMYVMLSETDPRCPKCKSTVLLDIHDEDNHNDNDDSDDDEDDDNNN
ncbi:hypothetical protein RND81_04G150700 [Saponaria officinalis]|uniref:GIR1-like zinc ribbon domain-containing protein n=1 Tax=Saponaria officinalis TaxID=3572 RepID=A0AAW1LLD9_SAPOF